MVNSYAIQHATLKPIAIMPDATRNHARKTAANASARDARNRASWIVCTNVSLKTFVRAKAAARRCGAVVH
jgi:hypothetical protein